ACGPKAAPAPVAAPSPAPVAPSANASTQPTPVPTPAASVDVEARLAEAVTAYDRQDFDRARALALDVVSVDELNVRALRMLTSIACIEGDSKEAKLRYLGLPDADRAQMRTRCRRYGIVLE